MARVRHIAIATDDPEATARFYKEGLGLTEAGRVDSPLAQGYYLTDGYVNIAILKFTTDAAATTEGRPRHTGVHHIGFGVDDMSQAVDRIVMAGAVPHHEEQVRDAVTGRSGNVEVKFHGPDGVTLDLSAHGWVGATG